MKLQERDQRNREEGFAAGLREGIEAGREEGLREGIEKGVREGINALILDNLEGKCIERAYHRKTDEAI